MNSYQDFLLSDEWQSLAEKRKRLDNYKCVCCGSTSNLNVHHITYKYGRICGTEWLRTLCHNCHVVVHKIQELYSKRLEGHEEYTTSGWLHRNRCYELYNKEAAKILAIEMWRREIWDAKRISNIRNELTNVAFGEREESKRPFVDHTDIMYDLALAKDCYIANPEPRFDIARRKAKTAAKTRFK